MSVAKGILNNGLANVAQKIVRILDQLLLVPFFLTVWGVEYYGEWLTLSIVPSILAFSDLGFGSAVCKRGATIGEGVIMPLSLARKANSNLIIGCPHLFRQNRYAESCCYW